MLTKNLESRDSLSSPKPHKKLRGKMVDKYFPRKGDVIGGARDLI